MVANATVAELSRRLQQEAVLLLSFYAGAPPARRTLAPPQLAHAVVHSSVRRLRLLSLLRRRSLPVGPEACLLLPRFASGGEGGCREHLNKLNAAVAGLQGLVSGVQVG